MIEEFLKDPRTISRIREGLFGKYLDSFTAELREQGYATFTVRLQVRLIADFGRWLHLNKISLARITDMHAKKYLEQRKQRPRRDDKFAIKRFLHALRQAGAIATESLPAQTMTPAEKFTDEYSDYLKKERALAPSTIRQYKDFVKPFLLDCFAADELRFSSLCPLDVIGFVQRQAAVLHRKRAKVMTTALKSFFQYLWFQGLVKLNLAAAVPTVANWKMAEIPKALPLNQVEQVIGSCDRETAIGRRNKAILLLLARLGLRAGEVAFLLLDDINWQAGYVTVRGKGGCLAHLPLPADVGEALADYLQNGRPRTSSRKVFLRQKAPIVCFTSQRAIGSIVARALARAGIESPRKGAHQFRHSLASKMLQHGASLPEIGELLRHQSVQTTEIYTKIDLISLRALAMPWPGGAK